MPKAKNKLQSEFETSAKGERRFSFSNFAQKKIFKIALLLFAAAFIAIGISRGENTLVLQKAVRICMECIGLG